MAELQARLMRPDDVLPAGSYFGIRAYGLVPLPGRACLQVTAVNLCVYAREPVYTARLNDRNFCSAVYRTTGECRASAIVGAIVSVLRADAQGGAQYIVFEEEPRAEIPIVDTIDRTINAVTDAAASGAQATARLAEAAAGAAEGIGRGMEGAGQGIGDLGKYLPILIIALVVIMVLQGNVKL